VRYDYPRTTIGVARSEAHLRSPAGWNTDITGSTEYSQLPAAAKSYIKFLEKTTGVTISVVGVGPAEQFVRPT